MTNSSQEVVNLATIYGQSGLHLYGHSRGSMAIGNALRSLDRKGNEGMLNNTAINFYGPAFNALNAANMLNGLSGGKREIYFENHNDDIVGRWIGRNPSSGFEKIPDGSSSTFEKHRVVFGKGQTVHSCYGAGKDDCGEQYGPSKGIWIQAKGRESKVMRKFAVYLSLAACLLAVGCESAFQPPLTCL